MATVANLVSTHNPTVSYARLYTREGDAVSTSTGVVFVDHDCHLYAFPPDQTQGLTRLGAVPAVERANVLAALERREERR